MLQEAMTVLSNPQLYGMHGVILLTSIATALLAIGYRLK